MQVCILLALLGTALAASDPVYWEPGDDACQCTGCGDPGLVSFDGAALLVKGAQKTKISGWGKYAMADRSKRSASGPTVPDGFLDKCKFSLRIITRNGTDTPLRWDWLGIGYGFKASTKKNWQNVMLAQNGDGEALAALRGEGFSEPTLIAGSSQRQEQVNPYDTTETCYWMVTKVDKHLVTFRSSCCEYAFNWRPNGDQTCWEWWVGEKYQDGTMTGMCGDCNGNIVDDFRGCPNSPVMPVTGSLGAISNNCSSGIHSAQAFNVGERV